MPAGFVDNGNNAFTMSSSGTDIWNNGDQFRFAYKQLSGDGSIMARVDSLVNTNVWAKAGVMIRESLGRPTLHACRHRGDAPGNGAVLPAASRANGASDQQTRRTGD